MTRTSERQPVDLVTKDLTTTSDKIRALARSGYSRVEIQKLLGIRYQHVRKVLVDAGIPGGLQERIQIARSPISIPITPQKLESTPSDFLLSAGFIYVGEWTSSEAGSIRLDSKAPTEAGVYALALDNVIVYVGLTLNGIRARMEQYRRGDARQKTSARVNRLIVEALARGRRVTVLATCPEPLLWNGLPVNTAAGLEAGLIARIKPAWNIQGVT